MILFLSRNYVAQGRGFIAIVLLALDIDKIDICLQIMADSLVAGPSSFDTHMSMTPDSPDSRSLTDSEDDEDQFVDDGGLTIRIPNPNIYMARQTHWKGRRGKPRCDNCRMNNLKVR